MVIGLSKLLPSKKLSNDSAAESTQLSRDRLKIFGIFEHSVKADCFGNVPKLDIWVVV